MNSISGSGFNVPGFNPFDSGQAGQGELSQKNQSTNSSILQISEYQRVTAASSMQKDIALATAEGDTVTISYQKNTAFLAEKYDAFYQKDSLSRNDNEILQQQQWVRVHSELFAYSRDEQFTLAISGDLNEDEQRDIREALERIDKLMLETMSGGDILAGSQAAAGIIGLENISAVAADYRYRSLVTIEEAAQANSITQYVGKGIPDDNLSGIPGSMSTMPSPALSSSLSPSFAASPATPMERLQELIDKMTQIVEKQISDKKMSPDQFLLPVEQLFDDHIARLDGLESESDAEAENGPHPSFFQDVFSFLRDGLLQQIGNIPGQSL